MIAGSIFENTIVVSRLAAWGSVIKGFQEISHQGGHVPICLHHVRQDLDRIEKSCAWHSISGGQFSDQDANL